MLTSPLQHGRSSFCRTNCQRGYGIYKSVFGAFYADFHFCCKIVLFHICRPPIPSGPIFRLQERQCVWHTPVSTPSCLVYPVTRCPNINKYSDTIIGSIHWSAPAVTWDNLTLPHKLATMGGNSASLSCHFEEKYGLVKG